ncbi:MAG: lipoate--protein ligase [Bacteroidales bacterium]
MLCIKNSDTNPYFNLAAEEYALKNFSDEMFMLWRNKPSIIVGIHQNTLAEINFDYVKQNNIDVIRRLSGGGAVFHDLGNLNFTFIKNLNRNISKVDFSTFTKPIIDVLRSMGLDANFEGRNDIVIDGKKISGNAQHVGSNRMIHHGTLLFSSVMTDLSNALKINPLKFKDKAVKSAKSRVTNIEDHLQDKMDVLEFRDRIMDYIILANKDAELYEYTEEDRANIHQLVEEKYGTWDWNFGSSPKYNFEKLIKTSGGNIEFHINVDKGVMKDIKIYGDFFNTLNTKNVEELLKGTPHEEGKIKEKLDSIYFNKYFHKVKKKEFLSGFFS